LSNIREAREELEELELRIASDEKPDEAEMELSFKHAYHHINTAWNVKHIDMKKYKNLTDSDFKRREKFPPGFDVLD
jgi:hypothetical protein